MRHLAGGLSDGTGVEVRLDLKDGRGSSAAVLAPQGGYVHRIVATLGLKEMTQGTLVRKLCTYTTTNPTRQALFEYDRLVRSIYTLKYLRDPQLERNIRRSQNRIESYHQLRAAVAKIGGKKELTGKNDIETDISNQCGRLISNAVVYYNSAILSRLLERLEAEGNAKGIDALARISRWPGSTFC